MFVEKENTEIVVLTNSITIVGLSLKRSGLPISFDSMGALWNRYGDNWRGKEINAVSSLTEYGVCLNRVPDYITGWAISETVEIGEEFGTFTIPEGKYIKDTFNAETFEKLVTDAFERRKVKAWAKKNKVRINPLFTIEVYPARNLIMAISRCTL